MTVHWLNNKPLYYFIPVTWNSVRIVGFSALSTALTKWMEAASAASVAQSTATRTRPKLAVSKGLSFGVDLKRMDPRNLGSTQICKKLPLETKHRFASSLFHQLVVLPNLKKIWNNLNNSPSFRKLLDRVLKFDSFLARWPKREENNLEKHHNNP